MIILATNSAEATDSTTSYKAELYLYTICKEPLLYTFQAHTFQKHIYQLMLNIFLNKFMAP